MPPAFLPGMELSGRLYREAVHPTSRPHTRSFHDRPYRVLHAERFTAALMTTIGNPALRDLPLTGAIDQFIDSADVLKHRTRTRLLAGALLQSQQ